MALLSHPHEAKGARANVDAVPVLGLVTDVSTNGWGVPVSGDGDTRQVGAKAVGTALIPLECGSAGTSRCRHRGSTCTDA